MKLRKTWPAPLALALAALTYSAGGWGWEFDMHKLHAANAMICVSQADAEGVVKAEVAGGLEAAKAAFVANDNCVGGTVNLRIVRVVSTFVISPERTVRVVEFQVELEDGSFSTFFGPTDGVPKGQADV